MGKKIDHSIGPKDNVIYKLADVYQMSPRYKEKSNNEIKNCLFTGEQDHFVICPTILAVQLSLYLIDSYYLYVESQSIHAWYGKIALLQQEK